MQSLTERTPLDPLHEAAARLRNIQGGFRAAEVEIGSIVYGQSVLPQIEDALERLHPLLKECGSLIVTDKMDSVNATHELMVKGIEAMISVQRGDLTDSE